MSERTYLQNHASQLRELIKESGNDWILVTQLEQRLRDVEAEMQSLDVKDGTLFPMNVPLPRVALFMRGGGVQDSDGIKPALAGEVLIQYERMFIEQALHEERLAARTAGRSRRRRGAPDPSLLFTGTPRGSFGLELVPTPADTESLTAHAHALQAVAETLVKVSSAGSDLEPAIKDVSPRLLAPMKRFLKTLAQYDVELRLAFSDAPSKKLDSSQIKQAAERLDREWVEVEKLMHGTFRGLTRESTVFDLLQEDGTLITGIAAESLTEEDFDRIDDLLNKQCVASVQVSTLQSIGGPSRVTYVLLDAKAVESDVRQEPGSQGT